MSEITSMGTSEMASHQNLSKMPVTVGSIVGELTWLFTQSLKHQDMKIRELSWLIMTPVLRKQFHLFREGERPIGAAIWATVNAADEAAILEGRFSAEDLKEGAWCSGDRLWLIELLAPFSTAENKQAEIMLADLMTGIFRGKKFDMLAAIPNEDRKERVSIDQDAGERLALQLQSAFSL